MIATALNSAGNVGTKLGVFPLTRTSLKWVIAVTECATTFLADRRYRTENTEIRHQVLGGRTPAITAIIAELLYEEWLLEIEAIACA